MKKSIWAVSALAILTISSCRSQRAAELLPSETRDTRSIVVLYENDVHCGIDGYSKIAGLRDAIKDTANCLVVSCGDYLQGGTPGAISRGQYIADIMHNMNYDAITLGNHEFDYGAERMYELIRAIDAPTTCVNFYDIATDTRPYTPYIIKEVGGTAIVGKVNGKTNTGGKVTGGIKVAFIGALTPTTLLTESSAFYDANGKQTLELKPNTIYQLVQQAADEARQKGAKYVIVLSHLGEDDNALHIDSHSLIAATSGIDAVLDGHTHSVVPHVLVNNKLGQPVPITQTGTQFANVGKLVIKADAKISTELIPTKSITFDDSIVKATTDSVKALYKEKVSKIICHSEVPITINGEDNLRAVRKAETNAGDLVCDAFRYVSGAQISITNGGGIRTSVPSGDLSYGDFISLLPFENYVDVVEVTGQEIIDLLEACCQTVPAESGDFPQVSGLQFTIDTASTTRVKDVKVQKDPSIIGPGLNAKGQNTIEYVPIDPTATYTLGTINYCITGGGLQNKLKTAKITKQNIMLYNESLMEYVTKKLGSHIGQEYGKPQGRIIIK